MMTISCIFVCFHFHHSHYLQTGVDMKGRGIHVGGRELSDL